MKAILFDLDGVLVDSETIKFQAISKTFKDVFGVTLPENDRNWIGKDERTNMHYFMKLSGVTGDLDNVISVKRKNYNDLLEKIKPIKGSIQFLNAAKEKKLLVALVSNAFKNDVQKILSKLDIDFDAVVTKDDVDNPKPAPDVYVKAIEELGVRSKQCIALEDSPSGVKAAKSAGVKCIGLATYVDEKDLHEADIVVKEFTEIQWTTLYP